MKEHVPLLVRGDLIRIRVGSWLRRAYDLTELEELSEVPDWDNLYI